MTKREYLEQLGFLVGARGRFTRAQVEHYAMQRPKVRSLKHQIASNII
jgi:hypothetical protein